MLLRALTYVLWLLLLTSVHAALADSGNRMTILYDAFGRTAEMNKDWGFAALIEFGGRRILFDTGNDDEVFARNVQAARIDVSRLDFVILSHRHLDHTGGLPYLLQRNPNVIIYAPKESFGPFGSTLPSSFYRKDTELPDEMRYFDGRPPQTMHFGTAWPRAHFEWVDTDREIAPGVHLIALVSDKAGTKELRELTLVLRGATGVVIVAGCSHPGIDQIVRKAVAIDPHVRLVAGGFHLPVADDAEIARVASALHDELQVERLAPGHCTGEPAFALFKRLWAQNYVYAGVGEVIDLPAQ